MIFVDSCHATFASLTRPSKVFWSISGAQFRIQGRRYPKAALLSERLPPGAPGCKNVEPLGGWRKRVQLHSCGSPKHGNPIRSWGVIDIDWLSQARKTSNEITIDDAWKGNPPKNDSTWNLFSNSWSENCRQNIDLARLVGSSEKSVFFISHRFSSALLPRAGFYSPFPVTQKFSKIDPSFDGHHGEDIWNHEWWDSEISVYIYTIIWCICI